MTSCSQTIPSENVIKTAENVIKTGFNVLEKICKKINQPECLENNIYVNESKLPPNKVADSGTDKLNVLVIMLDELVMLETLPKKFRDSLPGYNALKKMGINFTNYHTNRQMCGPSRSVYMSGKIDTGIVDNVEQPWQFTCKQNINDLNSTGKIFSKNAPNHITCLYGKSHLDTKLIPNEQINVRFSTNTVHAMKSLGFDIFNTFGDNLHFGHGMFSDPLTYNMSHPLDSISHDIMEDNMKYEGVMPFLKARQKDKKQFYLQGNFHNPHDIKHVQAVLNQNPAPIGDMSQYGVPYYNEQKAEGLLSKTSTPNDSAYYFNEDDQDAYLKNPTLIKNWFKDFGDTTYEKYKTDSSTLLYSETMTDAYWSDTNTSINPALYSLNLLLKYNFSVPDKHMIVNWKNYQNAYLTMIQQVDLYIDGIIKYLKSSGLINTTSVILYSDHGESAGAFGLIEKGTPNKQSELIPLCICSPLLDDSLKGTSTDKLCSTIDINPTLMDLANIDNAIVENMDGNTLFTKNKNNKLVLNPDENEGTFCIINGWQLYSSIFHTLKNKDELVKIKPDDSTVLWYDNSLLMKYASSQIIYNTFVGDTKYKLIIWYNLHALYKYDTQFNTDVITSSMLFNAVARLKNHPSSEDKVIEDINNKYLIKNIIGKTFTQGIEWINELDTDIFTILLITGILFDLVIKKFSTDKDQLVMINTPGYGMEFEEYNTIIKQGGFLYHELYNLSEDEHELNNIVDIKNSASEIKLGDDIIRLHIWDNFQKTMRDKRCGKLLHTFTFIQALYAKIFDSIKEGITSFKDMNDEQFNIFVAYNRKNYQQDVV